MTARNLLAPFRELTPSQRHAFTAAWAGWALDAFDFFIFIFALKAIAADFHTTVKAASEGTEDRQMHATERAVLAIRRVGPPR